MVWRHVALISSREVVIVPLSPLTSGFVFVRGGVGVDCESSPPTKVESVPATGADGLTCALVTAEVATALLASVEVQKKWCVEENYKCRRVSGEHA